MGPNICHQLIEPMVTQDFTVIKLAILINMKVLTFENMRFLKPLLTCAMIKNVNLDTGLLHHSTSHASIALLMATARLYNTDRHLSIGFV